MTSLLADLKYAFRSLRRTPVFTASVVLTLGLGIGATTAIFSVVNGVLLNPLPYREADRLFVFQEQSSQTQRLPAYLTFLDYRSEARSFDGVGYVIGEAGSLRTESGVAWFGHARVSEGFFGVLGTTPLLGRVLGTDDERPGAVPAASDAATASGAVSSPAIPTFWDGRSRPRTRSTPWWVFCHRARHTRLGRTSTPRSRLVPRHPR